MQPNHITYWLRVVEGSDVSQHGVLQRSNEMTYRLREVKDETRSACYFAAIQRDHVRATAVKGQDKFRRPRFCNNQMISQYSLTKGGQKARRDQHVILLLFKLNITYRLVVPVRAKWGRRRRRGHHAVLQLFNDVTYHLRAVGGWEEVKVQWLTFSAQHMRRGAPKF